MDMFLLEIGLLLQSDDLLLQDDDLLLGMQIMMNEIDEQINDHHLVFIQN